MTASVPPTLASFRISRHTPVIGDPVILFLRQSEDGSVLDTRRELRAVRELPSAHIEQGVSLGRDVALLGILIHEEVPFGSVKVVAEGERTFVVAEVAEGFDVAVSDAIPLAEEACC